MEDILNCKKRLQKYIEDSSSDENIKESLLILKKAEITPEILRSTEIGIVLNKFSKAVENEKLKLQAKDIIKSWKQILEKIQSPKAEKRSSTSSMPQEKKIKILPAANTQLDAVSPRSATSADFNEYIPVMGKSYKVEKVEATGDPARDKCADMLFQALCVDDVADFDKEGALNIARLIEEEIFKEFGQVDPSYKAKIRSRYLNLKNKENPKLRYRVLTGELTAKAFCSMTAEAMASDERKKENKMLEKQNLLNSQVAQDQSAETDQFKCGKCKQRRTKYYQLQTRSADEPMTTYVRNYNLFLYPLGYVCKLREQVEILLNIT